jgi:hypothetical protein
MTFELPRRTLGRRPDEDLNAEPLDLEPLEGDEGL